jgi:hypothetical protein
MVTMTQDPKKTTPAVAPDYQQQLLAEWLDEAARDAGQGVSTKP